ncbi:unnamed protein product [Vitrella brassicaformis CCMP3155]|uniref:Uncharacterized protein n=1 Tax=Vitrella brassicaformis (strain CCMP3155) TaxID=1169540 RepID=A0A0G4F948_VITBC|nr:unnamed protein product [Vitrella brassicaformis CCMP3155]|eukprot:CEM08880.1 unnamed protein product [Vitrella brassicaformis CCMP3155]
MILIRRLLRLRGGMQGSGKANGKQRPKDDEKEQTSDPFPPLTAPPPRHPRFQQAFYAAQLTNGDLDEAAEGSDCSVERTKTRGWYKLTGSPHLRDICCELLDKANQNRLAKSTLQPSASSAAAAPPPAANSMGAAPACSPLPSPLPSSRRLAGEEKEKQRAGVPFPPLTPPSPPDPNVGWAHCMAQLTDGDLNAARAASGCTIEWVPVPKRSGYYCKMTGSGEARDACRVVLDAADLIRRGIQPASEPSSSSAAPASAPVDPPPPHPATGSPPPDTAHEETTAPSQREDKAAADRGLLGLACPSLCPAASAGGWLAPPRARQGKGAAPVTSQMTIPTRAISKTPRRQPLECHIWRPKSVRRSGRRKKTPRSSIGSMSTCRHKRTRSGSLQRASTQSTRPTTS